MTAGAVSEAPAECDVAVVGAGIVGLAAARELAMRDRGRSVVVFEREAAIARHQTGHSSGVVHSGVYYRPGSLKAELCVAGAQELYEYCARHGLPAERTGKLIVATHDDDLRRLDELERRGLENGVPGLRRIEADEIARIEPHAAGIAALHSPSTGVVDFGRIAASLADNLVEQGGTVLTGRAVEAIEGGAGEATVRHSGGAPSGRLRDGRIGRPARTRAGAVVVCAGAWSDRLAVAAGAPAGPRIVPFRGAYLRLRPERADLVRAQIFAVPDPELPFLGAHLTRTLGGEVLLGPSALLVGARDAYRLARLSGRDLRDTLAWPGTWRLIGRHWRAGLGEIAHAASRRSFVASARHLVPALRAADFIAGPAGVRAQALARDGSLVDDFVVSRTERCLFVRNAPSPAATSALPLARLIADEAEPLLC
ncbi:MAG: L-2-hydroxyglutarate oxidase [Solirubrobacterales bacterium]